MEHVTYLLGWLHSCYYCDELIFFFFFLNLFCQETYCSFICFLKKLAYLSRVAEEDGWMLRKCLFEAKAEQSMFSNADI